MKKNISNFLLILGFCILGFYGCKKEIVQYDNLNYTGNKSLKIMSILQLNDSIYELKIKSNFHIRKSNLQITRTDLNKIVLNSPIAEFYNDSIFKINFNVKKFNNINDLTIELKYNTSVSFRAYFTANDMADNIFTDKIDFPILWKVVNIGGFQLKIKPDVFYNFTDLSLSDCMGRAENLIAPNGIDFDTDRFGRNNSVISFSKSSLKVNYLKYANPSKPLVYYNDFTVSFWVKPSRTSSTADDNFLIHPGINSSNGIASIGASIGLNQINIQSHANGVHTNELSFDYNFKDWTHIAFRNNNGVIYLFINGVGVKSSKYISSNLSFSLASCQDYKNSGLGIAFNNVNYIAPYKGLFDDFMIFGSSLTNVDILNLYNETK